MVLGKFVGILLFIIGLVLLLNPDVTFLNNSDQKYIIAVNDTSNDINFTFNKNYISDYYEFKDGVRDYHTFINLYSDDFKINTSQVINSTQLNSCYYVPLNKSYETSLVIDKTCLNSYDQRLQFDKTNNITFNLIEIEYKGAEYNILFTNIVLIIAVTLILFGILLALFLE